MSQSESFMRFLQYINAATSLAEQIQSDLKLGDEYSNKTVYALSEFKKEADKLQKYVDMLEKVVIRYN